MARSRSIKHLIIELASYQVSLCPLNRFLVYSPPSVLHHASDLALAVLPAVASWAHSIACVHTPYPAPAAAGMEADIAALVVMGCEAGPATEMLSR